MFLASQVDFLLARHTVFSSVFGEGTRDEGHNSLFFFFQGPSCSKLG